MRILRFLVMRLLFLLPIGAGVVTLTFALANIIPADPVRAAVGPQASAETVAQVTAEFGLDQPLPRQYLTYWARLFRGDLGRSLVTRRTVAEDLREKGLASAELAVISLLAGLIPGIGLGVLSAVNQDRLVDHLSRVVSMAAVSLPNFWVGLLLQLLLASALSILPLTGRIDSGLAPARITGLYLVDSLLVGDGPSFASSLRHILLPALTLSLPLWAIVARLTRSSLLNVMRRDYILNARVAAGLPEWLVIYKYALKNSLLATTSQVGLMFGSFLGGAVIVETVFDWPGLGLYVVKAAVAQDLRPILATTLLAALVFVGVNAVTDLIYAVLDPRIKL